MPESTQASSVDERDQVPVLQGGLQISGGNLQRVLRSMSLGALPELPLGLAPARVECPAWPPAGAAHGLRLGMRCQAHRDRDARALHSLLEAAAGCGQKGLRGYGNRAMYRGRIGAARADTLQTMFPVDPQQS